MGWVVGVVGEASCQFLKRSVKKTRSLTKAFCHSRQPGYLLHLTPLLPLVSSSTTDALMGRGGGGADPPPPTSAMAPPAQICGGGLGDGEGSSGV